VRRRGLLLAAACPAALAAPPTAPRPNKLHTAALQRLEDVVRQQIEQRPKHRNPLRWQPALVAPDAERLLWGAKTLRSPARTRSWRVALDTRTHWFYVAQVSGKAPVRFYGPLDEPRDGVFVDAVPALPAASAPAR